jgi:NitT/TauT family transport system permease protein
MTVLRKLKTFGFASLSTIGFFALWFIFSAIGVLDPGLIPGPGAVISRLFENIFTTDIISNHLLLSARRALIGFAAALLVGIALGFLFGGIARRAKPIAVPVFQFFEKMHPIAMFPIFMFFWGIGETSKLAIIFWVCVWPILFHTIDGLRNIDPIFTKSAQVMGETPVLTFFRVSVPVALPDIFNGVKFAVQMAFIFVVSVEMISSTAGLGWFIDNSKHSYNLPDLYSTIILVAILGIVITRLLDAAEKHVFIWKEASL